MVPASEATKSAACVGKVANGSSRSQPSASAARLSASRESSAGALIGDWYSVRVLRRPITPEVLRKRQP
jgi:hypothetical protein